MTRFESISLIRSGGHFWGNQTFPAIWCFSASKEFRGIRVTDVDIVDPTYSGIMFQTKYPEQGQGPAIGSATFNNLTFSDNFQNIRNTTSTFTLVVN